MSRVEFCTAELGSATYCGTGNIFHKRAYFLGEWGGKYFMGKGMIRVGFGLANLLNREPIQ